MTIEKEVTETELLDEVEAPVFNEAELAEEEAAFEAGFNATDIEPAADETPTDDEPAPEPETPEVEPEVAPDRPDFSALLEEHKAEMAKMRDTLFGKIGNLQQKIDSARSAATGISPKARERLQADFPELAEMLFEGADEPVPYEAPDTPPYEPPEKLVEKASQEFERKLLTRDHRDWEKVVGSEEFGVWKSSVLALHLADQLDETWDSDIISARITEFKQWQKQVAQKEAAANSNKARLESAVTPRGVPRSSAPTVSDDDEDAAMEAAFRKR